METLYERGQIILRRACYGGQVEMVRFLLDSQPPFGDIHGRRKNITPLLAAASSFIRSSPIGSDDVHIPRKDYLARSEELMQLLLDRGACARDIIKADVSPEVKPSQPRDTVLSLAIAGGSPGLLKRLIEEGADVQAKKMHVFSNHNLFGGYDPIWDVTILHISSFYFNTEGIQALFDYYRDNNIDITDMVSCYDTLGRLPLHWAVWGPDFFQEEYMYHEDDIVLRAIRTIKLLLAGNPDTINVQDNYGDTALHYAVKSHEACSHQHSNIAKFLCQNGANAGLRNKKGQTPLHGLGFHVHHGEPEPVDTSLITLLLAHGANVNDIDADGNTPLHLAAKNLQHVETVKFLLSQGADVNARNSEGNTPLHVAAGGNLYHPEKVPTLEDKEKVQNEMIKVLQRAGAPDINSTDEANAAGKTPRQIRDEKRKLWWEWDERDRLIRSGRGRGRRPDR
ncbi:hypothetical protein B7463_g1600, partial [Scytalidium lignicola]